MLLFFYTTLLMSKCPDGHIASRWHNTELSIYRAISLYEIIINTSKLTIIWSNLSVKYLEKIVDCYPQSDASDGIEQPASLFLVLYSIFCPHWSASGKPWSTTDDAAEATDDFFLHFFLIKSTVWIMNARSRFRQSAIPNGTVVREKRKKKEKR